MARSSIRLTNSQAKVLEWIKDGCPPGVYENDGYVHRSKARALVNRGLVEISGHGKSWIASATEKGKVWPEASDAEIADIVAQKAEKRRLKEARSIARSKQGIRTLSDTDPEPINDAAVRATRRIHQQAESRRSKPLANPKQVERRETFMRYKVMVTRVQVAERWVRAADEEAAAQKVRDEFDRPYGYYGNWSTTSSEIEVVEKEQTISIPPNPLSPEGPLLLGLKDAAKALGISYSMLYELANTGEIEWTQIGSRRYVPREALLEFIKENSHRGYHAK